MTVSQKWSIQAVIQFDFQKCPYLRGKFSTSFPKVLVVVLISDCKRDPEIDQLGEPVKDNYLLRRNSCVEGKPVSTGKDFWSLKICSPNYLGTGKYALNRRTAAIGQE